MTIALCQKCKDGIFEEFVTRLGTRGLIFVGCKADPSIKDNREADEKCPIIKEFGHALDLKEVLK